MRKIFWLILLIFILSSGCTSTYCARKYKVVFCFGNWGIDQQSAEFKKHRRLCMRQSRGCAGIGPRMFSFGGCYPEWVIRAIDECYQDCMERRGYKLLGLSNEMLNTLDMN